jgi:hypothetical protein
MFNILFFSLIINQLINCQRLAKETPSDGGRVAIKQRLTPDDRKILQDVRQMVLDGRLTENPKDNKNNLNDEDMGKIMKVSEMISAGKVGQDVIKGFAKEARQQTGSQFLKDGFGVNVDDIHVNTDYLSNKINKWAKETGDEIDQHVNDYMRQKGNQAKDKFKKTKVGKKAKQFLDEWA